MIKHEDHQLAILISIQLIIAHNFNLQLQRSHSYFSSTTNFYLPFGLGHYRTLAEHLNFYLLVPPHSWFLYLSYGCTDAVSWLTDWQLLQVFSPTEYKHQRTSLSQRYFYQASEKFIWETIHWNWTRRSSSKNVVCNVHSQGAPDGGVQTWHGQKELPNMLHSRAVPSTRCTREK